MSTREPSQNELMAMAYADGELTDEARAEFERAMSSDPNLTAEVSELRRLEVLARQCAAKEPLDYEWERIRSEPVHVAGTGVGWTLGTIGVMSGIILLLYMAASSDFAFAFKLCFFSAAGGFFLLLAMTLRVRLMTLRHDPYRDVQR